MTRHSKTQMTPDRGAGKTIAAGGSARARRGRGAPPRQSAQASEARPKEINGRDGPDPVRYGDWEVKGIASDF